MNCEISYLFFKIYTYTSLRRRRRKKRGDPSRMCKFGLLFPECLAMAQRAHCVAIGETADGLFGVFASCGFEFHPAKVEAFVYKIYLVRRQKETHATLVYKKRRRKRKLTSLFFGSSLFVCFWDAVLSFKPFGHPIAISIHFLISFGNYIILVT